MLKISGARFCFSSVGFLGVPTSESHAPGFTTSERAEIPPTKHGVWRTPVADHLYPKFAAGSLTRWLFR